MNTIPSPVGDISDEKYAAFGKRVAALLGSLDAWGSDELGVISTLADQELGVSIGEQNDELFHAWHTLADELGLSDSGSWCELCRDMFVTTFLSDGQKIRVPKSAYEDWQYEVANGDTYLGLGNWFKVHQERENEDRDSVWVPSDDFA